MLIDAGDVAGKGLQASMLVALLVGAIRNSAQFDPDSLVVLKVLNLRLCGRSHAAVTCRPHRLCANTARAKIAAPGVDARRRRASASVSQRLLVQIEGSLPLGTIEDPEFSVMRFSLAEGDPLLLMSDSIAETTDEWDFLRLRTYRRHAARIHKFQRARDRNAELRSRGRHKRYRYYQDRILGFDLR